MKGMASPAAGAAGTRECMDQYGQVGDEITPWEPALSDGQFLVCQ